jgi:long-subunit fatty acid transport protein
MNAITFKRLTEHIRAGWVMISLLAFTAVSAKASGIYRNGVGARSMSLGGADVAWAADPLGAMAVNPAGLGFLDSIELNLGVLGGITGGTFEKGGNSGNLDDSLRALPEAGFALPVGSI